MLILSWSLHALFGADNLSTTITLRPGRQLLVDDSLISESTLTRIFHAAHIHPASPVLKPETTAELRGGYYPCASPFDDGVFFDGSDGLFKMWYNAGWNGGIGYVTSHDGLQWTRPNLDVVPGTNLVLPHRTDAMRDGVSIWLDAEAHDPAERFKMFAFYRVGDVSEKEYYPQHVRSEGANLYTSPDGIHWTRRAEVSPCGDNTTFFRNPFRGTWGYSIRTYSGNSRTRGYFEHPDFLSSATWHPDQIKPWAAADARDLPDPKRSYPTQLYAVDAVAYESLMIGLFSIHKGPPNEICEAEHIPKTTDLMIGFSSDGITWDRPVRTPFIGCSQREGAWDRAYLHSAGGCCLVVGDELWFYFGAWSGLSPKLGSHLYSGGTTGLATLRRDGFASLEAGDAWASMTTRPFISDGSYPFINVDASKGEMTVEVLNSGGEVIAPFTAANCVPLKADRVTQPVAWADADSTSLRGNEIRLRFRMRRAALYSFWLSKNKSGASRGYVAAGGPGFLHSIDDVGAAHSP